MSEPRALAFAWAPFRHRAFALIWTAWLYGQEWWRRELWREGAKPGTTFESTLKEYRTNFIPGADANNLILQMRTWEKHDVGSTPGFDGDAEKARRAKDYFRRAGVAKRIEVRVGNALELVKKAPGTFDLVFNDVDKHQYPDALHAALPKLRRGGLFITDNTLWSGKAARPAAADDADTQGVQEFNRLVYASKKLYPVLIPLRDGVTVCQKL